MQRGPNQWKKFHKETLREKNYIGCIILKIELFKCIHILFNEYV